MITRMNTIGIFRKLQEYDDVPEFNAYKWLCDFLSPVLGFESWKEVIMKIRYIKR